MRKTSKINKLVRIVAKTFFVSILTILILYNIVNIDNKKQYIKIFGYKVFVVEDYQEQSTIKKDTVIIAKSKNDNFQINDLVAIRINDGLYFHRVTDVIGNELYITKGDDNHKNDEKIFLYKEIEGKVVKQIPWLGRILNIARTKIFSIILLIIFIIAFKYNKHVYIRKNNRRLKQKSQINNREDLQ